MLQMLRYLPTKSIKMLLNCRFKSSSGAAFVQNQQMNINLNLIGGKRLEGSGTVHKFINPATGEPLGQFCQSTTDDINQAISYATQAQKEWAETHHLERAKIMHKAADLIRNDATNLTMLEVFDTGKVRWEAEADVMACADSIDMFAGFGSTVQGTHVHLPGNSFYYTRREPLGVCAGIGAWNYPFQMAVWKSAPALACGNALVFKPSELTPLTAVRIGEIYHAAGCPPGLFSVVQGSGSTGAALAQHPGIAKMSFTGSVSTGSRIMAASSEFVRPVTLELGGKSPLLIFPDADLEEAVKGAILANFLTQGQVCSNGTRVFVHKDIKEQFTAKLIGAVSQLKAGDPMDDSVTVGSMISETQMEISLNFIRSAVSEGAVVAYGGERWTFDQSSPFNKGFFLRPCILNNCRDDMTVVKEEVFGPVLSLLEFNDEAEVLNRANDSCLGLAAGIFTQDLNLAHRIAGGLQAGSIYINTYNATPPGVPFGGYKMSGFGRENGLETMQYYTQIKSIYVEGGKIDYPYIS